VNREKGAEVRRGGLPEGVNVLWGGGRALEKKGDKK